MFLEKKKKFGGCCFSLGIVVVLGFEKKKERERPRSIDQLGKEKKKKKRKKEKKSQQTFTVTNKLKFLIVKKAACLLRN